MKLNVHVERSVKASLPRLKRASSCGKRFITFEKANSSRHRSRTSTFILIRSLQNRFPSIPMRMLLSNSLISPIEFFPIALYLACGFSNPYSALKLILQGQRLGALCTTARQRIAILAIRRRHIDIQRSQGASASVSNFVRLTLFNK